MALTSGTRLGSYEISDLLGKGGMGEVYRARDMKLGREVAIKVLPAEFAKDAERLARLEREARMLAALNHPNIAAIHGLEESDDTRFLVLELVEGDTLADQIKRGPIPVEESLKLALQIAEALEAAHEKGVIHRDLKPANIKVTPDGKVKVLDFGLAKAFIGDEADVNLSNSPTLSMAATQAGMILGTAAYMSPEQASGEVADHRADVWAFGVALYEMLSGRQLFTGKTASHVMGAVLEREPDWNSLPTNLHPVVRELLERCLEKDVKDRRQSIADVRFDLQKVLADPEGVIVRSEVQASSQSKLPWVVVAVLALVSGLVVWSLLRSAPQDLRVARFTIQAPSEGPVVTTYGWRVVTISPDGGTIAYASAPQGAPTRQIYIRPVGELEATVLRGTEGGGSAPFFSPDGQSLGFVSELDGQTLSRVSALGGPPTTIGRFDAQPWGMHWASDDTILFSINSSPGLWRIPAVGGEAEQLTTLDEDQGEAQHGRATVLPDGNTVLLTVYRSGEEPTLARLSLDTREITPLSIVGSHPSYVPTGHVVYVVSDGTLRALPFDADRGEFTGTNPIPVIENVNGGNLRATGNFGVGSDGSLVYLSGATAGSLPDGVLTLVDRAGRFVPLDVRPDQYRGPRVSPDGTQVAVEVIGDAGRSSIWIYDLSGNRAFRRLLGAGSNMRPIWTPDGSRITFASDRDGSWGIYSQLADGSGAAELLVLAEEGVQYWPDSWSPDSRTLAFTRIVGTLEGIISQTIWTVELEDDVAGAPQEFVPVSAGGAAFSPEGNWIAYRSGNAAVGPVNQIHVQPFPSTGAFYAVTEQGGSYPVWSRGRRELLYRRPAPAGGVSSVLAGVEVTTEAGLAWGDEFVLPVEDFLSFFGFRDYDIVADGEQIVVNLPAEDSAAGDAEASTSEIILIQNWFEELKERVPVP